LQDPVTLLTDAAAALQREINDKLELLVGVSQRQVANVLFEFAQEQGIF